MDGGALGTMLEFGELDSLKLVGPVSELGPHHTAGPRGLHTQVSASTQEHRGSVLSSPSQTTSSDSCPKLKENSNSGF